MRVTLPSIRGYVLRGEGDNDRIVRHVSLLFGAGERGVDLARDSTGTSSHYDDIWPLILGLCGG